MATATCRHLQSPASTPRISFSHRFRHTLQQHARLLTVLLELLPWCVLRRDYHTAASLVLLLWQTTVGPTAAR